MAKKLMPQISELKHKRVLPVALTIAGSDSGGGAGIQADLKTFAAVGVHGVTVITCVTAQNPKRILAMQSCEPSLVLQQLLAVFEEFPPQAVKTGMLFSSEIVRQVARFLGTCENQPPLIVDPVAVATSGGSLLQPKAGEVLRDELLPLASLVTPNLPEAEALTGRDIREPEEMRQAARFIWRNFGCPALVKGGHLKGTRQAVDIFYDGKIELLLTAPFIEGLSLHGAGCAYSAAIAAFLALGCPLSEAVQRAKGYITRAIARSVRVAAHSVLASPLAPKQSNGKKSLK